MTRLTLRIWLFLSIACTLPLGGTVMADEPASEESVEYRYDRFQLFNYCKPMRLVVEELSSDAADTGLTKRSIQASVESRLRSARLFDEQQTAYLYVNINVFGAAYNIYFAYNKPVLDFASGETFNAGTWYTGSTGTHGRNSGYILSSISQHMDQFLVKFLRVNESACD